MSKSVVMGRPQFVEALEYELNDGDDLFIGALEKSPRFIPEIARRWSEAELSTLGLLADSVEHPLLHLVELCLTQGPLEAE